MRRVVHGHTWGMSALGWYQLQAELVSLEKRKECAERKLERLEENQRNILYFNNPIPKYVWFFINKQESPSHRVRFRLDIGGNLPLSIFQISFHAACGGNGNSSSTQWAAALGRQFPVSHSV